jgi:HK97 family phage prohead protease
MKRAYSLLEIRSVDEKQRVIEGIASTPTPDVYDDIIEPRGAQFKLPLPLLWQHNAREPIGHVTEATVTDEGIRIRAEIARSDEPGKLKDRLDEAWQSVKIGLVRGLSIGFKPIEKAEIEGSWGYRYLKWLWLELSAVTIPANIEASMQTVKSFDRNPQGRSLVSPHVLHGPLPPGSRSISSPGASGNAVRNPTKPEE